LDSSDFDLTSDKVDLDFHSTSTFMRLYGSLIKSFKTPVVYSTQVAMNLGFKTLFNREFASIQSNYEKVFSTYLIKTFFNIIPVVGQDITIPEE